MCSVLLHINGIDHAKCKIKLTKVPIFFFVLIHVINFEVNQMNKHILVFMNMLNFLQAYVFYTKKT